MAMSFVLLFCEEPGVGCNISLGRERRDVTRDYRESEDSSLEQMNAPCFRTHRVPHVQYHQGAVT